MCMYSIPCSWQLSLHFSQMIRSRLNNILMFLSCSATLAFFSLLAWAPCAVPLGGCKQFRHWLTTSIATRMGNIKENFNASVGKNWNFSRWTGFKVLVNNLDFFFILAYLGAGSSTIIYDQDGRIRLWASIGNSSDHGRRSSTVAIEGKDCQHTFRSSSPIFFGVTILCFYIFSKFCLKTKQIIFLQLF